MVSQEHVEKRAELCQNTLNAADDSMFKYLSFFAAMHAAAFTALVSSRVGLPGHLDGPARGAPGDPMLLVLPAIAVLMSVLCYVLARGLSKAGVQHKAAARHGRGLGGELGGFFEDVHPSTPRSGSRWRRFVGSLLTGRTRLLPRHVRAGAIVTFIGMLWGGLLWGLTHGFPPTVRSQPPDLFEGVWGLAGGTVAGLIVLVGTLLLVEAALIRLRTRPEDAGTSTSPDEAPADR